MEETAIQEAPTKRFAISLPAAFFFSLLIAVTCVIYWLIVQQAEPSFGYLQVEQVIHDRPEMGEVIKREPALRKALEAGFESELSGSQVEWDFREPRTEKPAEHFAPTLTSPTLVRVSKKLDTSGVDKCAMLLFELENTKSDKDFTAVTLAARERKISRDDYANGLIRLEYSAFKRTHEYFRDHPLAEANDTSNPYYAALLEFSADFPEFLQWQEGSGSDPHPVRQIYLQDYDRLTQ